MNFNLDQQKIEFFLYIFPVLVISVALHEFAHCWTDDRLGDDTPRRAGRVTLNPLAHLDPLGTIMMVVSSLSGFGFGWGKPSPFNPNNFRHPARDRMIGALAGPVSNIFQMLGWASLGLLLTNLVHNEQTANVVLRFCYYGTIVNASLAIFNLLPIYPLDGHHILSYLAPPSWRPIIDNQLWGILFLVLMFTGAFSIVIDPIIDCAEVVTHYIVGWPPV